MKKGIIQSQQAVPFKPKPTPPPLAEDFVKAIQSLRLNISRNK